MIYKVITKNNTKQIFCMYPYFWQVSDYLTDRRRQNVPFTFFAQIAMQRR